jgi:TRAP-type C4-dicarboxylate transport system permease large subunit
MNAKHNTPASRWSDWLTTLPTATLLALILVISTGEMIHGQLLRLGDVLFRDSAQGIQYFMLRADPTPPACNPHLDIDAEVQRQLALSASAPKDDVDALFGAQQQDPAMLRTAVADTVKACVEQQQLYERVRAHITPQVKFYRRLETSFLGLFQAGSNNRSLVLMLLLFITAVPATLDFKHLCIRPPRFRRDYQVQAWSMLIANGLMLFSAIRYYQIASAAGVALEDRQSHIVWMLLFAALALAGAYRLLRPPVSTEAGDWKKALECMPLVASMGIIGSVYFFSHNHPSGPAIYANKMLGLGALPLALALHIWAGMLFKQSRLVDLFMNILRPWNLSPEALTYIILLVAGLPTAYAGMSSVFVIAAGAIIYHEVRAVGGSSQFALAATAMSGSLGAVLRPSLLVVGIAAMNRQVTTAQLFHWGGYVFALTSTMFFIASQLNRRSRHQQVKVTSPALAVPAMLREMKAVLPFVAVVAVVLVFYAKVLDTPFDELSAPSILPVLMLLVVFFDRALMRRAKGQGAEAPAYAGNRQARAGAAIHVATTETVEHVGAYVSLIVFTQLISGMVERSDIMSAAPEHFPNVWLAMAFLVAVKVLLGMVMEPLGAIILVSSTLAPLAYSNGIMPVHFWMMVMVAFELGYLLPPVAINQLFARQVVGSEEIDRADHEVAGLSYYRRHERWLLPCAVMALSLLVVAFGPLLVQHVAIFKPLLDWLQ